MNHITYIRNLYYSFLQNDDILSEHVMFIKHFNTLDISLEEIEKIVGEEYKEGLLYHAYYKNDIKEPYEPFMNGIRYYYQKFFSKGMTVEEFIEECDVYPVIKDVFVTYLTKGIADRREMINISELSYEKYRFISSIINCIKYIARIKKILIVLDRFQYTASTSIDVVEELISDTSIENIKIMVIYSEIQQPLSYVEDKFEKLINRVDEKGILFEWDEEDKVQKDVFHAFFVPNRMFFSGYLRKLNNLAVMLALDDAKYYIDIIDERINDERIKLDDEGKFEFYYIAAMIELFSDNENNALIFADKLISCYDSKTDLVSDYRYNIICARIHLQMLRMDLTIKYSAKSKEIAKKLNNDEMYFNAEIISKSSYFDVWRDVFNAEYDNNGIDYDFVEKLKQYGYKNTLIHYLIYSSDNDYNSVKKFAEGIPSKGFTEAIEIGQEIENNYFLQTAYTKYIAKFTNFGFHKYVDGFYAEKMKIIDSGGISVRKAFLYLGMGYNCIVNEKYVKANDNFIKGIELLLQYKRVDELIEAMYNMGINCICAEDYMSACDYFNVMFKMLDNMNILTIKMCNSSKLHGLHALAFYKLGNEYRCLKCLRKMESLLSHILYYIKNEQECDLNNWNEDLFLYNLLSAIIYKKNDNLEKAGEFFTNAEMYFSISPSILFYAASVYFAELYEYYEMIGNMDKAYEVLDLAMRYCKENGYNNMSKRIINQIEKRNLTSRPISTGLNNVNVNDLLELSHNVGIANQLDKRRKDIKFMAVLQEMLNKDYLEYDTLIDRAVASLQNNFNFSGSMILEFKDNSVSELHKDIEIQPGYTYEDIKDYFVAIKREFIVNRTDKSFEEYNKILSMFEENEIITFIGVPVFNERTIQGVFIGIINMSSNKRYDRSITGEEELVVIKTAVIQLFASIERIRDKKDIIEVNKKLTEVAVTDMLTGLYNRQGLSEMMSTNARRKDKVTILYADLDNFKYYNDTFGHDLGDVILKSFSNVIKDISKKIGYAVRYGGDEFLVVLENVNKDEAAKVAEQIYERISDGFIPVIEDYLNEKIDISKDKYVSCSIGIAKSEGSSFEDFQATLKKADEALYYMKRTTKRNYILWEDMKDNEEGN